MDKKVKSEKNNSILNGYVLPGLPHPLLCPEKNEGWQKLRKAFGKIKTQLDKSEADLLVIYSTMWPSVIGHQIQADPHPEWVHVDEQFHDLGSIPYKLRIDEKFAHELKDSANARGLHARTVNYKGFPIDTGSLVALKLINPDNKIPVVILSSNVYADRTETVVLGKAVREVIERQGRKAVPIVISTLSNRLHQEWIEPKDDRIHSLKDEEWNRKMLELFSLGRLEDVAQLSRQVMNEARVKKVLNFKPIWWLSAVMGEHNRYTGQVYEYQPVYGTGSAVIGLTPAQDAARDLEFDEESPETYLGERNVLGGSDSDSGSGSGSDGFVGLRDGGS